MTPTFVLVSMMGFVRHSNATLLFVTSRNLIWRPMKQHFTLVQFRMKILPSVGPMKIRQFLLSSIVTAAQLSSTYRSQSTHSSIMNACPLIVPGALTFTSPLHCLNWKSLMLSFGLGAGAGAEGFWLFVAAWLSAAAVVPGFCWAGAEGGEAAFPSPWCLAARAFLGLAVISLASGALRLLAFVPFWASFSSSFSSWFSMAYFEP
mmetsp:Transcript_25199/g.68483  ORF Transcript_25199/g.68483 Transcript_25199/m.68483 type:complete len:205 (-) Transcript_25199:138-752(-)